MRQELQAILDRALAAMCREIDPDNGLLRELLSAGVLSAEQIESCKAKRTAPERIEEMVKLLKYCPDSAYELFRRILSSKPISRSDFVEDHLPCFTKAVEQETMPRFMDCRTVIKKNEAQLVHIIETDYGLLDQLTNVNLISWEQQQTTQNKPTSLERNYQFLHHLSELRLDEKECSELSKVLMATNQQHAANVLFRSSGFVDHEVESSFGDIRPLTSNQRSIIDFNYFSLIELIDPNDLLLEILEARGCITPQQRKRINSDQTIVDRNVRLLNILRRRSVRDYKQFEECLRKVGQPNVAKTLTGTAVILSSDVKFDRWTFSEAKLNKLLTSWNVEMVRNMPGVCDQLGSDVILMSVTQLTNVKAHFMCESANGLNIIDELYRVGKMKTILQQVFTGLLSGCSPIDISDFVFEPNYFIRRLFVDRKGLRNVSTAQRREFPGFVVHDVPLDGNCMFSALADQLHCNGIDSEVRSAMEIRNQLVDFIRSSRTLLDRIVDSLVNRDTTDSYLNRMNMNGTWGDGNILSAASLLFKTRIEVYTHGQSQPIIIGRDETDNQMYGSLALGFVRVTPGGPENHYVSLRKETTETSREHVGEDQSNLAGAYGVKHPSAHVLSTMREELSDKGAYDVIYDPDNPSHKRGLMLIIANTRFIRESQLSERTGTNADLEKLTNVFSYLKFRIQVKENLTAEEMRNACIDESQSNEQSSVFALFVLSHGDNGVVFGTDGNQLGIDDMMSLFDGKHCQRLVSKPKLFFVQACQGDKKTDGTSSSLAENAEEHEQIDMALASNAQPAVRKHELADMALILASPPGYASWRNVVKGSYFVTCLTEVLFELAHKQHFVDMMVQVTRKMDELEMAHGFKQVPVVESKLCRKLYLLPY